jgi:hypothetical protein
MGAEEKLFLVGDNPFHGISHLSQERSRVRGDAPTNPEYAAKLILISLENGANGFMFSVSETTLSILNVIDRNGMVESLSLYAIVPYAYEYVRLAGKVGGVPGLAKRIVKEVAFSGNLNAIAGGLKGVIEADLGSLVKTYLAYEISRIRSSAGKRARLESIMLHQLITDMCLGFDMDWFFDLYVNHILKIGFKPGFNTGNFAFLVKKFREWNINLEETVIAAPFNKIGFQMNPSREECEKVLADMPKPNVLAISILAAGYLKPKEAIDYIANLPNIKGVAVGVSKESHAYETFKLIREKLNSS